ncbi:hypothetical protein CBR_g50003 [Chara braunii]|uniref:FAD/NAD(P)-binding domain-containing protein n=1 Tax=Chara braunii TaxID=69332 RepID=A0A388K578_CHABU|nr:hypothetical protein CBR_g50003 [Chara braunii]|eukprot:GBG65212.1 hypothetical protein CBR_g50003 [Chara braunii]
MSNFSWMIARSVRIWPFRALSPSAAWNLHGFHRNRIPISLSAATGAAPVSVRHSVPHSGFEWRCCCLRRDEDTKRKRQEGSFVAAHSSLPRVRAVATNAAVAVAGDVAPKAASTCRPLGNSLSFCIVGSGPAGFYTAERLLKSYPHATVDIVEKLPSPFGLVRSGVAPDHPETKAVINQFSRLASVERCKFWGNVQVGRDVSVAELRQYYNAVVFAYGAEGDKTLGIPGEDYKGVVSAREFVWWYNGHPEYAGLPIDLTGTDTAVVLGQGNVALDCARVLLRDVDELAKTDIAEHALEALRESRIRTVLLVGRRGPAQAACTAKELREVLGLRSIRVLVKLSDTSLTEVDQEELKNSRSRRRVHELFVKAGNESGNAADTDRQINFTFFRAPKEILGKQIEGGHCADGLRLERTMLQGGGGGKPQRAVGTGEMEDLPCGLVLRSIGYKSLPLPGLPFDNARGIVPNKEGRIIGEGEEGSDKYERGMYVVGWVKRGPTGIIGTNLVCADQTVASIAEDEKQGLLPSTESNKGTIGLMQLLSHRQTQVVDFEGWNKIAREEVRRGALKGKPREKILSIEEMLKLSRAD